MGKKQEKDKNKDKKNQEQLENKQVRIIIISIILILIVIFGIYFYIESSKSYEYNGIKFEKIRYGEIPFHYSKINILRPDNQFGYTELYLRLDPRKNNVPVDIDEFKIMKSMVYLSVESKFSRCEDSGIALVNLARFYSAIGFPVKSATNNKSEIRETVPFVNCENKRDQNTVFLMEISNQTRIYQDPENKDCYVIEVSNCEVLQATEKLIIDTIVHFKNQSSF